MLTKRNGLKTIILIDGILAFVYILSQVSICVDFTFLAKKYLFFWEKGISGIFFSLLTAGILLYVEYDVEKKIVIRKIYDDVFEILYFIQKAQKKAIDTEKEIENLKTFQDLSEKYKRNIKLKIDYLFKLYSKLADRELYKNIRDDFDNIEFLFKRKEGKKKFYNNIYIPTKNWKEETDEIYFDANIYIEDDSDDKLEIRLNLIGRLQGTFFEKAADGTFKYKEEIANVYDYIEELRCTLPNAKKEDSVKNPFK